MMSVMLSCEAGLSMFHTQIQLTEEQARELKALAAGKFHSGLSDLSEEHDRYLAEAIENR
jgi:hypothetical protein